MNQTRLTACSSRKEPGAGPFRLSSIGIATYRTDQELTFYLRALQKLRYGRLVVVLGLRGGRGLPAELPKGVRLILTMEENEIPPEEVGGCIVTDPQQAVIVAMDRLHPQDGLILLFPADWRGESPDSLIDRAQSRQTVQRLHGSSQRG